MFFPQYKKAPDQGYLIEHFQQETEDELIEHPRAIAIIDFLEPYLKKNGRIIEAGASFGRFLYLLQKRGYRTVSGFDINEELIKRSAKLHVNIVKGDIFKMPYQSGSCDGYIDIGTMEHFSIHKQREILNEIARILKPSGLAAIDVAYLNPRRMLILPIMVLKNWYRKTQGAEFYQYLYSAGAMKRLLEKNGFTLIKRMNRGPRMLFLAQKNA